jgi:hypothetical protein
MCSLSNATGPIDYSETPGEVGDSSASFAGKINSKKLITRANAVPIMHVFKHYNLRFDTYTFKAICPFLSHKGGRENTPSFKVYEDTNTFKCFGCGKGSRAVNFVAEMDRCTAEKAALKILGLFSGDVDENLISEGVNPSERLEIMTKFASSVYEFRQNYSGKHATDFIEYICWVYDQSNGSHDHDNDALRRLVEHCIEHIEIYNPQMVLTLEEKYLNLICNS